MSSSNRRERELARQKRERQLAKASGHKRRNQNLVVYLIGLGVLVIGVWAIVGAGGSPTANPSDSASPTKSWCSQAPQGTATPKQFEKYTDAKLTGDYTWKLDTNCGVIEISLLADKAPETVKSFKFLSDRDFFVNTPCHRLTTQGLYVLQCGDPTGTGTGGPGYTLPDENLPKAGSNNYPAGTVAMANSGPNTGGSQFFIVYQDTTLGPDYTIFGKVTKGLDIVQRVAADGDVTGTGDGAPSTAIGIRLANVYGAKG